MCGCAALMTQFAWILSPLLAIHTLPHHVITAGSIHLISCDSQPYTTAIYSNLWRKSLSGLKSIFQGDHRIELRTRCIIIMLSSRSKNSISKMTNGWVWRSRVKSRCLESEWVRVRGTWLQLLCCAVSHRHVPNFGRQGWIGDRRFGDDFVVKDKSWTRTRRRRI